VLVIGDLCLDVRATTLDDATGMARLAAEDITSASVGTVVGPGGTAWLFADALTALSRCEPLIVAAVGNDPAGQLLVESVSARGWDTQGIGIVPSASDVVVCVYMSKFRRFMTRPAIATNNRLEWTQLETCVARHAARSFACVWISGYALLSKEEPRFDAVANLCQWAHENTIAVVLDLVPHNFLESVGSLAAVEALIGKVDVVVTELATIETLQGRTSADDATAVVRMHEAALSASGGRTGAAVQHRTGEATYSQALSARGEDVVLQDVDIPATGPYGLCDRLAVEALQALRLID
jgi:sugar/nucleoside kinase (ribokinase family)